MRCFGDSDRDIITFAHAETDMSCPISYQYCRSKSHSSSTSRNFRYFPDFQERFFKSLQFFFSHRETKQKYKIKYVIITLSLLHREILLFRGKGNHFYQKHNDQFSLLMPSLRELYQQKMPFLTLFMKIILCQKQRQQHFIEDQWFVHAHASMIYRQYICSQENVPLLKYLFFFFFVHIGWEIIVRTL